MNFDGIKYFFARLWKKHRMTGLVPAPVDERDWQYVPVGVTEVEADFHQKMGVVEYQSIYNACVWYATCKLFNYYAEHKKQGTKWPGLKFSECYGWYMQRKDEGRLPRNEGVCLRDAFKIIKKYGLCTRDLWDFQNGYNKEPNERSRTFAEFSKLYQSQFGGYYACSTETSLNALSNEYPVVFRFPVTEKLMKLKGHEVYEHDPSDIVIGYHGLISDGYNVGSDGPNYIAGFNSWATSWGNRGRFRISMESFRKYAAEMWTIK